MLFPVEIDPNDETNWLFNLRYFYAGNGECVFPKYTSQPQHEKFVVKRGFSGNRKPK